MNVLVGNSDSRFEWQHHSENNGHKWEAGYREGILRVIRCANCGLAPIEVLRKDLTSEPCRSAKGPTT